MDAFENIKLIAKGLRDRLFHGCSVFSLKAKEILKRLWHQAKRNQQRLKAAKSKLAVKPVDANGKKLSWMARLDQNFERLSYRAKQKAANLRYHASNLRRAFIRMMKDFWHLFLSIIKDPVAVLIIGGGIFIYWLMTDDGWIRLISGRALEQPL